MLTFVIQPYRLAPCRVSWLNDPTREDRVIEIIFFSGFAVVFAEDVADVPFVDPTPGLSA